MMPILRFLYSQPGRIFRVVVGVILIIIGASLGGWWWLLALLGLLPVVTGTFDICTLGPPFGRPLRGREFRASVERQP